MSSQNKMNIKTAEKRIQHTPGPWRWNPGQPLIAADGFMVNGTSRSAVESAVNRALIAGASIPNTAEHLSGWVLDSQSMKPGVIMPQNTLNPEDLKALVAYLENLK